MNGHMIMDEQIVKEVEMLHAQVCLALGDPKRILILYALSQQRRFVGELAEELNCPQPTVSRHLKVLRERGLVNTTRDGTTVYYSVADARIIQALDLMRAMLRDRMLHQADLAEFRALDNTRSSEG
ncbi:MAG: metalloregulator ArsR/SmtB family transcription factor [Anaerolineae bacterium]|nr:metalloregulator ArsR/SmtB family transcription factor [Anaerolineae bacterium]